MKTLRVVVEVQTREEDGSIVEFATAHVEGMGVRCFVEVMTTNNTEEAAGDAVRRAIMKLRAAKDLRQELITFEAFAGEPEAHCYWPLGMAAK